MDVVIASVHSFPERGRNGQPIFNETGKPIFKKRTPPETAELYEKAFLGAIKNPHVDILGHPTRHLPIEVLRIIDWDKIFDAASKNGMAIEINLNNPMVPIWPEKIPKPNDYKSREEYLEAERNYITHLEYCRVLREILKKAVDHKVKFFIGTDWHTLEQFWQPFRNFNSKEMELIAKVDRGEELDLKQKEQYSQKILPKLNKLPEAEREMIRKIASGRLTSEEIREIDIERLSQTPGPKFWIRYGHLILELIGAEVKLEDIINTSREKLLEFSQIPKSERYKL
jgi:hypothetical protein